MTADLLFVHSARLEIPLAQAFDFGHRNGTGTQTWTANGPEGLHAYNFGAAGSSRNIGTVDLELRGAMGNEVVVGMWYRAVSHNRFRPFMGVVPRRGDEGVIEQISDVEKYVGISFDMDQDGRLVLLEGSSGTSTGDIITEQTNAFLPDEGEWHFWEVRFTRDPGVDVTVDIRIDDGDWTYSLSAGSDILGDQIKLAGLLYTGGFSSSYEARIHGLYVHPDTMLGPLLVQSILPATQGNYDDFSTASLDTKAEVLSSDPIGTETVDGGAGDRDTYNMGSFTKVSNSGTIMAVCPTWIAQSAGTELAPAFRRSGADQDAPVGKVMRSVAHHPAQTVVPIDPYTSAPWEESDINDTEFGMLGVAP